MGIEEKYLPYNFSSTKCYVFELDVDASSFVKKIDDRLPLEVGVVKGVYVTTTGTSLKSLGYLFLSFNQGERKFYQIPLRNSSIMRHHSQPLKLNEEVKSNSAIQGFLFNNSFGTEYTVKVYIHYELRVSETRTF